MIDISGWVRKSYAVQASIKAGRDKMVKQIVQDVMREVTKNLSGPRYGKAQNYRGSQTGKMPIPVLSGKLKGSLKFYEAGTGFIIYCKTDGLDGAPYAPDVHNGTTRMKGRPFMKDGVDTVKRVYLEQNKKEFMDVITFVGRS